LCLSLTTLHPPPRAIKLLVLGHDAGSVTAAVVLELTTRRGPASIADPIAIGVSAVECGLARRHARLVGGAIGPIAFPEAPQVGAGTSIRLVPAINVDAQLLATYLYGWLSQWS
jgi:hypothetical protein